MFKSLVIHCNKNNAGERENLIHNLMDLFQKVGL